MTCFAGGEAFGGPIAALDHLADAGLTSRSPPPVLFETFERFDELENILQAVPPPKLSIDVPCPAGSDERQSGLRRRTRRAPRGLNVALIRRRIPLRSSGSWLRRPLAAVWRRHDRQCGYLPTGDSGNTREGLAAAMGARPAGHRPTYLSLARIWMSCRRRLPLSRPRARRTSRPDPVMCFARGVPNRRRFEEPVTQRHRWGYYKLLSLLTAYAIKSRFRWVRRFAAPEQLARKHDGEESEQPMKITKLTPKPLRSASAKATASLKDHRKTPGDGHSGFFRLLLVVKISTDRQRANSPFPSMPKEGTESAELAGV